MRFIVKLGTDKRPFKKCPECGVSMAPHLRQDSSSNMTGRMHVNKYGREISLYRDFISPYLHMECGFCHASGPAIPVFGEDMKVTIGENHPPTITLQPSSEWMENYGQFIWETPS